MNPGLQKLAQLYDGLEAQFNVVDASDRYAQLVRADTNTDTPVQRWFHFKEAFSIDLLQALLSDWKIQPSSLRRILDPFCGVGTTLLAAQKLAKTNGLTDLEVVGFERNPFLHFVASTKASWHRWSPEQIKSHSTYLLNGAVKNRKRTAPALSTLHKPQVYDTAVLSRLLGLRKAIASTDSERDALLLGYASALEAVSGVRKDGRALRIETEKERADLTAALSSAWTTIADDIVAAQSMYSPIATTVCLGDGRRLLTDGNPSPLQGEFDIVVYSPPYPNNIDYTEVYKIELWMCGFVDKLDAFRALRYNTFRSHPSVRFQLPTTVLDGNPARALRDAIDLLASALPQDHNLAWRTDLFRGYFDDICVSLQHQMRVLKSGGRVFCIVGNSLHGPATDAESRVPVAADLFIALAAHLLGFKVDAIQVARHLIRRAPRSDYLRESIVVMQKP